MYVVKTSKGFLKDFVPRSERKRDDTPEPVFTKYEYEAKRFGYDFSLTMGAWLVHFEMNCTPVSVFFSMQSFC